jgi:multidrug resistance efflux pump
MNHKRPPIPAIILVLLVVAVGGYFIYSQSVNQNTGALTASGFIEATQVNVAPELAGKVTEVLAEEGQSVSTNDPLLRLDPSLLTAQRDVAAASLASAKSAGLINQNALNVAQAQYQVTLDAALAQDKKVRLGDWYSEDQQRFDQPNWYFTRAEQAQAAQIQVDEASKAMADAKAKLADVEQSLDKADFLAAEQRLLKARLAYLVNKDVDTRAQNAIIGDAPITRYNLRNCAKDKGYHYASPRLMNQTHGCTGDEHLTKASEALYNNAKDELDNAQRAYNDLLTTQAARDVLQARADVSVAQERYDTVTDRLRALQTGNQSPNVTAAQRVVDQAQAAYDQSQKAVAQAEANLALLDTQIAKLTISSPMEGVVLTRNVEPGEFVQPGATAFVLGQLSDLTITVYIPEDRYGEISLGQQAIVTVDSFPGVTFKAEVIHIADQAEFTPRNVQTVEGRSSTVFAIKLKVTDSENKLKIGMPADVVFK